ncbi:bifunctional alpha/beta hydrolase/class I SAM-dependent methyltransferase [Capnocytophaga sp. G2]|uniref:bifunctional alpha/beta hydrolase/class I SAM-dependent methyltransferase n=1 Tax=Capnocytophaga sp. G2 TaxID=3110695 RepID=UPI002B488894|nr:bifunctional alpha/beta hydrolase/class I SAM-dependent methyltransferase [Capnocytophaga sp. G2]MEB3004266.1 bifunctional alpha/beta hydrolase/class I SAM-dependent methyltransferase [Capnocytophaga sp. G2]
MNTGFFNSYEGAEIFFYEWNYKPGQKTLIVIHRGHEYGERLQEFATHPLFASYNIFAFDMRGHGHTKASVSPAFMDSVRDLDTFTKFLQREYAVREEDIFVVANSIGGVIVSAWVHDFAPHIAGMALLAPAFEINLLVPLAKQAIELALKVNPKLIVKSYVKSKMLTHDPKQQQAYDTDRFITRSINGKLLIDLANAGKRLVEDAAAITIPTLLLSAEEDFVVINKEQKQFYVNLSSEVKEFITLKGFHHGILFEKDREEVYKILQQFITKAFETPALPPSLTPDKFTQKEFETMQYELIPRGEKWYYHFQKWALGKLGHLSSGMEVGLEYGFDSGVSMDYVYKNIPQGKWGIGKWMDKNYLNAVGWRGVRIRKTHLLQQVEKAIQVLQVQGRKVKILDIAGGVGNYLFDVKERHPEVEIVINEFLPSNIEKGEKIIREKGYTNIRFTNYNCFNKDNYRRMEFSPNITIISGIFELFGNNTLANEAVKGVVSISDNGFLIYTGQPWHPQLKTIAFVLKSHQDKDWVMRRRSQRELDSIFALNGVQKESMLIDDFGIFTVSLGKIIK